MIINPLANKANIHIRDTDVPDETDIILLKRRVDNHLIDYESHKAQQQVCYERNNEAHEKNMLAIRALTESTQEVVDAWRVAGGIQKFLKWLSGFAILGAFIALVTEKIDRLT